MSRPRGFTLDYVPQAETAALIAAVQKVLAQYVPTYGPMTLRQIFYRLVATTAYPKREQDYKRLGETLVKARRSRLIGFDQIRDDGDVVTQPPGWLSLDRFYAAVRSNVDNFALRGDLGQPFRTILLVEAAGMVPQVDRVAAPFGVEVRSAGGFDSVTGKHALAENIVDMYQDEGRPTRLLHIGDYDPSGEHIFLSLVEDVAAFVDDSVDADDALHPDRIALTEAQINQFAVVTAIKKVTDNRSFPGVNGDGTSTAQLEALAPPDLAVIVRDAILAEWDQDADDANQAQQAEDQQRLAAWMDQAGDA